MQAPEGKLITEGHYFDFSSIFFYTNREALLLTDRRVNLEYGSYAPGAPHVFIDDSEFKSLWSDASRCYLVALVSSVPHFEGVVGPERMHTVATSGGKVLLTNEPISGTTEIALPPPGN
jgi:hypothetical protein